MLLDTCAFLWLAEGSRQLSKTARDRLSRAALVYVSAISAFEIGLNHRSGKLRLPMPPAEWFASVVAHHALETASLGSEVCLLATQLPPLHGDPCDRLIIATAKTLGLPVVTTDPRFEPYGIEVVS